MKLIIASALAGSAAAFVPAPVAKTSTAINAFAFGKKAAAPKPVDLFTIDSIPGAIAPTGLFDPLGFAEKADELTLKKYREAELTHGRVGK